MEPAVAVQTKSRALWLSFSTKLIDRELHMKAGSRRQPALHTDVCGSHSCPRSRARLSPAARCCQSAAGGPDILDADVVADSA
jgi:hypothetical protein